MPPESHFHPSPYNVVPSPQRPSSGQTETWSPHVRPTLGTASNDRHLPFPKLPIPQVATAPQPIPVKHNPYQTSPSAAVNGEAVRRLSSSRASAGALPSPIHNAPSFSPTQGNHDVGPLAGFPTSNYRNVSTPVTPHGGSEWHNSIPHPAPRLPSSGTSRPSFSPHSRPPNDATFHSSPLAYSNWTGAPPTSLPTSQTQGRYAASPSQYGQHSPNGFYTSGLSPTKHSPTYRAPPPPSLPLSAHTSHPILPPIRELKPSPKLMGRSSPEEPIPAPIKSARPEQQNQAGLGSPDYWAKRSPYTTLPPPEPNGQSLFPPPTDRTTLTSTHPELSVPKPAGSSGLSPSKIPQSRPEAGSPHDKHSS